jgi:hypothetical protein
MSEFRLAVLAELSLTVAMLITSSNDEDHIPTTVINVIVNLYLRQL